MGRRHKTKDNTVLFHADLLRNPLPVLILKWAYTPPQKLICTHFTFNACSEKHYQLQAFNPDSTEDTRYGWVESSER